MNEHDRDLYEKLTTTLISYNNKKRPLPGIQRQGALGVFVNQIMDSIRRITFYSNNRDRKWGEEFINPDSERFNPIKAAMHYRQIGNVDEGFWLVFLATHFGWNRRSRWYLAREVYRRLGEGKIWNWVNIANDPMGFRVWLGDHQYAIKPKGSHIGFGNHRKYESLNAFSKRGTGAVVQSYIKWVGPTRSHQSLIDRAYQKIGIDPKQVFDFLYHSMQQVIGFGRTGCFDYLSLTGEIGLVPIEPKYAYFKNATGPLKGAQLLFGGNKTATINEADLEDLLRDLDAELFLGMRVLEDALCNWQKSPDVFVRFRG